HPSKRPRKRPPRKRRAKRRPRSPRRTRRRNRKRPGRRSASAPPPSNSRRQPDDVSSNRHQVLVPRTRSSHHFSAGTVANFGFKSGTRIIELLVSLDSEVRSVIAANAGEFRNRDTSVLFEHDLFRKPVSTLGSSPRAGFFGIMLAFPR